MKLDDIKPISQDVYEAIKRNLHATFSNDEIEASCKFIRRRDRVEQPDGNFDEAGRFRLCRSERHGCCSGIRTPSRKFPMSEMVHARTAQHCASLYNVDVAVVRRAARIIDDLESSAWVTNDDITKALVRFCRQIKAASKAVGPITCHRAVALVAAMNAAKSLARTVESPPIAKLRLNVSSQTAF